MGRVPEGPSMDSIIETNTTKKKIKITKYYKQGKKRDLTKSGEPVAQRWPRQEPTQTLSKLL
jgi:hypothetical protein